eukprot:c18091_g1_i1 orf=45-1346(-)
MSCKLRGSLRTGEKVGGSKKRVHFSDEEKVRTDVHGTTESMRIGATIDAKSCRFADEKFSSVEVSTKPGSICDVNVPTTADFMLCGANTGEKSHHIAEEKLSLVEVFEKATITCDVNATGSKDNESPPTTPPCANYGLATVKGRSHSQLCGNGVQRKLTFAVGAGGGEFNRKCGFTNKKNLSRVQNYKVVPEVEGTFSTGFLSPHLNVLQTFGASEGACKKRCAWITPQSDAAYVAYHDEEWGVPEHEDRRLFEMLVFAGAQTEIAWSSILAKREAYRNVFAQFDPAILATYDTTMVASLKSKSDVVRSEARVQSIVSNAKLVMKIVEEYGSFNEYLWGFVGNKPIVNKYKQGKSIPVRTGKSEVISKDLQRRGFRHAGPMVVYSLMQAAGLANDHLLSCFRHNALLLPTPSLTHSPLTSSPKPAPRKPLVCC